MSSDGFRLTGGDASFSSRSKGVFDSLGALEDKHKTYEADHKTSRQDDQLLKRDPDREPIDNRARFRRPSRPPPRRSKFQPHYEKHPTKWKKYDLTEVDASQGSDRRSVESFLKELKQRKEEERQGEKEAEELKEVSGSEGKDRLKSIKEEQARSYAEYRAKNAGPANEEEAGSCAPKLKFSKPKKTEGASVEKTIVRGTTFVMPEYVVGQSTHAGKAKKSKVELPGCDQVELGHLDDLESGDGEEDKDSASKSVVFKKVKARRGLRKRDADSDD